MNSMRKYVVTTTLDELGWSNSTPIRANVAGEVEKLKQQDGGPILVAGSRTLVHTLMEHDLVDEYRADGLPNRPGLGQTALPGLAAQDPAGARGHDDVRHRRPGSHVPAGRSGGSRHVESRAGAAPAGGGA
jgi:dihydrofolate reductase